MKWALPCLIVLMALVGCYTVPKTTPAAAQATFDAVAPEWEEAWREKFKDDPALPQTERDTRREERERRERLLKEWESWIEVLKKAAESPEEDDDE